MNDLLCRNKRLDFKRISDALSCALQVRQFFRVDHLCQEVTDSCCLTGTCIYGFARGIRGQLIQICGIRTAADDVDAVVGPACDLLQAAYGLSVRLRQAAVHHRGKLSHGLRYRLSRLLTVLFIASTILSGDRKLGSFTSTLEGKFLLSSAISHSCAKE